MTQGWFYAEKCPCEENCSRPAWKRARCAAESEDKVRQLVKKHLMNSSLHKKDRSNADYWANTASIKYDEYPAEEIALWTAPQKRKRQKTHRGDEPPASRRSM